MGRVAGKRRSTNHPCPICGKTYVNEGSLRKHISSHPEAAAAAAATPLRMWPCSVCQSVFTQEAGLLHHMENMRMDPKHQFAAQYVLSRAAAERREKQGPSSSGSSSAALSAVGAPGTSDQGQQQLMVGGHSGEQQQQSNGSQPGPSGTVMPVGILPLTGHHQQHP